MSWNDELAAYLGHLENGGKASGYVSTAKTYLTALGKRYTPESYLALTYEELDNWFGRLRKKGLRGKPLAESSLKTAFTHARACLRWLHFRATGRLETPPNILGMRHGKAESRVASLEDLLTDADLEKLLDVLDAKWRCALLLLRWSGARPSEILGLARKDAVVKRHDGREYTELTFRHTMNDRPRPVPVLKPEAVDALKVWLNLGPQGDLLFPSPRQPDQPLKYRSFWKALKTAAKRAGLEKNVFPYLARHTRASELYEAPSAIRDAALGFQTPTMWKNYTHIKQADAMRDYLWDETEGGKPVVDEGAASKIRNFFKIVVGRQMVLEDIVFRVAQGEILTSEEAQKLIARGRQTMGEIKRWTEGVEGGVED